MQPEAISQETGRNKTLLAQETVIKTLNRMMVGWANYFCLGLVSKAYRAVERHARKRLRQWLCAKHQLRGQATNQYSITALHQALGLVELTTRTSSFPWAKTVTLSPRLDARNAPVRFDEREQETEHAKPD